MKRTTLVFFFLPGLSFLFSTCRKEEPKRSLSCEEYEIALRGDTISIGPYETYRFEHLFPCVNPNDPAQFCYVSKGSSSKAELRVHDLKTGYNRLIYTGYCHEQPVWSTDGKLYVNDNGSRIIQIDPLTKTVQEIYKLAGIIYGLTVSPDGKQLLFRKSGHGWNAVIISTAGAVLKEFHRDANSSEVTYQQGTWQTTHKAVGISKTGGVAVTDLKNDWYTELAPYMGPAGCYIRRVYTCKDCDNYYAPVYHPGIGVAYQGGLWKINALSGASERIKGSCYLNDWESMSVISDEFALVSKKICYTEDAFQLDCYRGIFLLNLKTGKEEMIHLP